jgi:hypothetical protein
MVLGDQTTQNCSVRPSVADMGPPLYEVGIVML